MNEPFDPEKVMPFDDDYTSSRREFRSDGDFVLASDYKKVLAQHRHLKLIAEQAIRDLCYEGGTLAGRPRMAKIAKEYAELTSQRLHHTPDLEWGSLLVIPDSSPATSLDPLGIRSALEFADDFLIQASLVTSASQRKPLELAATPEKSPASVPPEKS